MEIITYTDITTRGVDPTQLETWECKSGLQGLYFTVTQFFGDYYMLEQGGYRVKCPEGIKRQCQEHAEELEEKERAEYDDEPFEDFRCEA